MSKILSFKVARAIVPSLKRGHLLNMLKKSWFFQTNYFIKPAY